MLKRMMFLAAVIFTLFTSTLTWAGAKVAGNLILLDGGEIVFPDGSVQSKAQVQGPAGPTNKLTIGTVNTGTQAAATVTGTAPNQVLNLTLPQGPQGVKGDTGAQGPVGQVSLDSICNAISAANKVLPLFCSSATLLSIEVTPTNQPIVLGMPQQFTATGTFSDNSTQDLTASLTWSSSTTSVATISNTVGSNGKATPVAVGTSTIVATSGSISGSTILTVNQPTRMNITIALNPPVTSLGGVQFSLISDPGATYNNDISAINGAVGQMIVANPLGNRLTIGLISSTYINTLATPIISLSYAITAGTLPGVQVSPTNIYANDGTGQAISPPLTPANFVVTVNYI